MKMKENNQIDLKYLLCIINSKLINLWYKYFDTDIEIISLSENKSPSTEIKAIEKNIFSLNIEEYENNTDKINIFSANFALKSPR